MKKLLKFALLGAMAIGIITGCSKNDDDDENDVNNHTNNEANSYTNSAYYSFTPPTSWTVGTVGTVRTVRTFGTVRTVGTALGEIVTFTGPVDGGFSPNMNIATEQFDETLEAYTDLYVNYILTTLFSDAKVISQSEEFQTNGSLKGKKIVYTLRVSGVNYRLVQYYISPKVSSNVFAVISGAGLATWGDKYDAMFDTAAKSFAWK